MERDPFKEYLKESEPDKVSKGYAWSTAIGLQAVDGLKPSKYLIDTAIQNIEGKITLKEAQPLIDSYYEGRLEHLSDDERTEEADKVSSRIVEILSEAAFFVYSERVHRYSPQAVSATKACLWMRLSSSCRVCFKVVANAYL